MNDAVSYLSRFLDPLPDPLRDTWIFGRDISPPPAGAGEERVEQTAGLWPARGFANIKEIEGRNKKNDCEFGMMARAGSTGGSQHSAASFQPKLNRSGDESRFQLNYEENPSLGP